MFDVETLDPVVGDAVDRLAAAVDALCAVPVTALSDGDLLALVQGMETQRRRLPVAEHRVVAEVESRGVAGLAGYASTATLLGLLLRLDPGEARARVSAAADLAPRLGVSGEPVGAVYPQVAAAQADGAISERHAAVIRRAVDDLPLDVQAVHGDTAERVLTEQAAVLTPGELARVARRLQDTLNPDGTLASETEQDRRRSLRLIEHRDGTVTLQGLLTAVCAATLRPVLDSLSAPDPATPPDHGHESRGEGEGHEGAVEAPVPDAFTPVRAHDIPPAAVPVAGTGAAAVPVAVAGTRDPRTAAMRAHDALETMAAMLLRSGHLPHTGGTPVTLLLTITAEQAATGTGFATTAHGALIPTPTALVLADEADIYTVICTATGGILDYGRTRRLATPAQRLVLAARDRGCSFPGCTAPPSWCDTHHITTWLHGGNTNIDELTLLCRHHHRQVDRETWLCHMNRGRPWWTPPAWLDRTRTPRLNTAHHPLGIGVP